MLLKRSSTLLKTMNPASNLVLTLINVDEDFMLINIDQHVVSNIILYARFCPKLD